MDEENLWDTFKKTGHIADYLRYRGVDIYAVTDTVDREEAAYANRKQTGGVAHDRGTHHTGI